MSLTPIWKASVSDPFYSMPATDTRDALLLRIADALERIAPPRAQAPDFDAADAFVWGAAERRLTPVFRVSRIAAPNPLRDVQADGEVVADIVKSVYGPFILVGHSYGGSVISQAATGCQTWRRLSS